MGSIFNDFSSSYTNGSVSCTDKTFIQTMILSLQTGIPFKASCNQREWKVYTCPLTGALVLCIDCYTSCTSSSCPGQLLLNINPCMPCKSKTISFGALRLDISSISYFPKFIRGYWGKSGGIYAVSTARDTIVVNANLSVPGIIHCAAFPLKKVPQLTTFLIRDVGVSVESEKGGGVSVSISNLYPSTTYQVTCFTEDFFSHTMDISLALTNGTTRVKTACCREIFFPTTYPIIPEYQVSTVQSNPLQIEKVFTFALSSLPSLNNVIVSLSSSIVPCPSDGFLAATAPKIIPIVFNISAKNPLSLDRGNFVVRGSRGCYNITAADNTRVITRGNISVLANSTLLYVSGVTYVQIVSASSASTIPPRLSSAVFSSNGLFLIISLTIPSDRGATTIPGYSTSFTCSLLLIFVGAESSSCKWTSSSTITAVPATYRGQVTPPDAPMVGGQVELIQNKLKAECLDNGGSDSCSGYVFNGAGSIVTITYPYTISADNRPIAAISTSPKVSSCDNIIVDPTASKGQSGRPWVSVNWGILVIPPPGFNITNTFKNNVASIISIFMGVQNSTSSVITVPNSLLYPGVTYQFSLTVKNFLGLTSTKAVTKVFVDFSSSVPLVSIPGPSVLQRYRWQSLNLFASAILPSCQSQSAISQQPLTYTWRMYKGVTYDSSLVSTSLDPRVFSIPAYSLNNNTQYAVKVTVSTGFSSATAQVIVQIGASGVVASISGGQLRTISPYTTPSLILDASKSYSLDFPNHPEYLTYQWKCIDYTPATFGNPCPSPNLLYGSGGLIDSMTFTYNVSYAMSGLQSTNRLFNFSVTVTSSAGDLGDVAWLLITVVPQTSILPSVSISGPLLPKFNPATRILINGTIGFGPSSSDPTTSAQSDTATARWSSLSLTSTPLANIALTPLSNTFYASKSSSVTRSVYFQLGLQPNSLVSGLSYTFQLSAYLNDDSINVASSVITLVMNTPPIGGALIVNPMMGLEMNTTFYLQGRYWFDDPSDYPLTYIISAYSLGPQVDQTLLKSKSEIDRVKALLNRGAPSLQYRVTCMISCADIYNSPSSATTTIQVKPVPAAEIATSLQKSLAVAFSSADVGMVGQVLSAVTSAINSVNCSSLPYDCSKINRRPCSTTTRTCGPCLDGYVGQFGDSNTLCQAPTGLKALGDDCLFNRDCASGYCVDTIFVCGDVPKKCPNKCSNKGSCIFYDNRGNIIDNCFSSNSQCTAACACTNGAYGADCSLSAAQYQSMQMIREDMCVSMYATLTMQDVTDDVIASRARTIASILLDMTQITNHALNNCTAALVETVLDHPNMAGTDDVVGLVVQALSGVLAKGTDLSLSLQQQVSAAIQSLSLGRQQNIAVGEPGTSLMTPSLRLFTAKQSPENIDQGQTLTIPQSTFETYNRAPVVTVAISTSSSDASGASGAGQMHRQLKRKVVDESREPVGITLVQFANNFRGITTDSSALQVQEYHYGGGSIQPISFVVTLQNMNNVIYYNREVESRVTVCPPHKDPVALPANCTYDSTVNAICPGNWVYGYISTACPASKKSAQCLYWDGDTYSPDPNCVAVRYTPTNTTCVCNSQAGVRQSRLLQASSSSADVMITREFSSVFNIISTQAVSQFTDEGAYAVIAVEHNKVIFMTTLICVAIMLAGVVGFSGRDIQKLRERKKQDKYADASNPLVVPKAPRTVHAFFARILPQEFDDSKWYVRFWNKFFIDHDWLFLMTYVAPSAMEVERLKKLGYRDEKIFYAEKWVVAIGRLLNFIFIDTLLASAYFADNGKCQSFSTEEMCLSEISIATNKHLCTWRNDLRSCLFTDPTAETIFQPTFIVATLITILVIPLDKILRYMVAQYKIFFEDHPYFNFSWERRRAIMAAGYSDTMLYKPGLDGRVVVKVKNESTEESKGKRNHAEDDEDTEDEDNDEYDDDIMYEGSADDVYSEGRHNEEKDGSNQGLDDDITLSSGTRSMSRTKIKKKHGEKKNTPNAIMKPKKKKKDDGGLNDARLAKRLFEMGDELKVLQLRSTTLIQGAKLVIMQKNMDFVPAEEEMRLLLENAKGNPWYDADPKPRSTNVLYNFMRRVFRSVLFEFDDIGDPLYASQLIHHASAQNRAMIVRKLIRSRARAERIVAYMHSLATDGERDEFLMKRFLVDSMPGLRHTVAFHYFFGIDEKARRHRKEVFGRYFSVVVLPLYVIGVAAYIYFFGVSIGARATNLWLLSCLVSFIYDIAILQPLKILFKWVIIVDSTRPDMKELFTCLRTRFATLIRRKRGLMRNVNSLVQHFNPACRAARAMPHLPISRLLMSLTDWDLPPLRSFSSEGYSNTITPLAVTNSPLLVDKLDVWRHNAAILSYEYSQALIKYVIAMTTVILVMVISTPDIFQDAFLEALLTTITNSLIAALFFSNKVGAGLMLVILIFLICIALYLTYLRYLATVRPRYAAKEPEPFEYLDRDPKLRNIRLKLQHHYDIYRRPKPHKGSYQEEEMVKDLRDPYSSTNLGPRSWARALKAKSRKVVRVITNSQAGPPVLSPGTVVPVNFDEQIQEIPSTEVESPSTLPKVKPGVGAIPSLSFSGSGLFSRPKTAEDDASVINGALKSPSSKSVKGNNSPSPPREPSIIIPLDKPPIKSEYESKFGLPKAFVRRGEQDVAPGLASSISAFGGSMSGESDGGGSKGKGSMVFKPRITEPGRRKGGKRGSAADGLDSDDNTHLSDFGYSVTGEIRGRTREETLANNRHGRSSNNQDNDEDYETDDKREGTSRRRRGRRGGGGGRRRGRRSRTPSPPPTPKGAVREEDGSITFPETKTAKEGSVYEDYTAHEAQKSSFSSANVEYNRQRRRKKLPKMKDEDGNKQVAPEPGYFIYALPPTLGQGSKVMGERGMSYAPLDEDHQTLSASQLLAPQPPPIEQLFGLDHPPPVRSPERQPGGPLSVGGTVNSIGRFSPTFRLDDNASTLTVPSVMSSLAVGSSFMTIGAIGGGGVTGSGYPVRLPALSQTSTNSTSMPPPATPFFPGAKLEKAGPTTLRHRMRLQRMPQRSGRFVSLDAGNSGGIGLDVGMESKSLAEPSMLTSLGPENTIGDLASSGKGIGVGGNDDATISMPSIGNIVGIGPQESLHIGGSNQTALKTSSISTLGTISVPVPSLFGGIAPNQLSYMNGREKDPNPPPISGGPPATFIETDKEYVARFPLWH